MTQRGRVAAAKGRPGAPFARRVGVALALGLGACSAGTGDSAPADDTMGVSVSGDSAPAQLPAPRPLPPDTEDPALLDARDAEEYGRRVNSMQSREDCLAGLADVPESQRARLQQACERLPAPR